MFTGEIRFSACIPADGRWLPCIGSDISRTTYATLFAAIGTTWGAGDGSTTFGLPNMAGRSPMCYGNFDGIDRTIAEPAGSNQHTLTPDELAGHTHAYMAVEGTQPGQAGGDFNAYTTTTPTDTGQAGVNQPFDTTSPVLVVYAWIWSGSSS